MCTSKGACLLATIGCRLERRIYDLIPDIALLCCFPDDVVMNKSGITRLLFALGIAAAAPSLAAQEWHPFIALGRAVQVRGYPVPDDASQEFKKEQAVTFNSVVQAAQVDHGKPLFQDGSFEDSQVQLVYRDALIIVSARYSTRVICRVDIPTSGLRDGLPIEAVTEIAARSCRASEERGWGSAGYDKAIPIGSEELPGPSGAKVRIYATEQPDLLFQNLLRGVEIDQSTTSSLVRGKFRDYKPPLWRYAWYADGTFLALRYQGKRDYGRPGVEFACALIATNSLLHDLDMERFSSWCTQQADRLRPGLSDFVTAVGEYRVKQFTSKPNDPRPRSPAGFHFGPFPVDLVSTFWRTGSVASQVDH